MRIRTLPSNLEDALGDAHGITPDAHAVELAARNRHRQRDRARAPHLDALLDGAFVRAIEQVIIDALADFGLPGERVPRMTGVWVRGAKVAAIGVHISRWVTSHGFALNVNTDLSYFQYIVPCGLTKPVTSIAALGVEARREDVVARLVHHFGRIFEREMSGDGL